MGGILRKVALLGVAGIVATLLSAVPAWAAPALVVTPNTGLADGQLVTVAGSGYSANASIGMAECRSGATGPGDCDLNTASLTTADSTGSFSVPFIVSRILTIGGTTRDCAINPCIIGAANVSNFPSFSEAAFSPISFNPNLPLAPPLSVSVTVNPTGTFTKAGDVTVSGTVDCNRPAQAQLDVDITQRAGRQLLHGFAFSSVLCTGATPWTLSTSPQSRSGVFRGGSATVTLHFFAHAGHEQKFGSLTATVRLRGK